MATEFSRFSTLPWYLRHTKPGSGRQRYSEPDLKYTAASFSAGEEA